MPKPSLANYNPGISETPELDYDVNLVNIDSVNSWNHKGSKVPPVPREETRLGDCEGITTHAVVAISVGAVIGDRPP